MTLSTKQTLILIIILVLIVLGGYYFLFSTIKHTNEKASLFSQEIDLYAQREATLKNTQKMAEELNTQMEKLGSYFLHTNDTVPFIELVEGAGVKTGVNVTIGSISPVVTADSTVKGEMIALRLEARGSWSNIYNFILYMENLPYKVSLEKVNVSRSSSVPFYFAQNGTAVSAVPEWSATIEMNVLTIK